MTRCPRPGTLTGQDHPDDQDGESKQEDNPDSPSDLPPKRRSSRRRSSGSSPTPSDAQRTSKRNSRKAPAAPQLRSVERAEDSSSCRPEGTPPVWPVEKARGSLPGPIVWDDLRLDVQRLICSGIFLKGAVSWLQEDRPVHTRFCQGDLVEMLSRMMFWNKLNESHWPKYVPERYYLAAEARLDDLEGQEVQPLFWGGLSAIGDVEEDLPPEDFEPEQDDKSKDADWSATDEGVPAEDASEVESGSEAVTTSKRRKRRCSQTPSADQPPAKRSRGGSRSLLAQKDYSSLTTAEKAMVELPEDNMVSWRHHGTRVKHADPSPRRTPKRSASQLIPPTTTIWTCSRHVSIRWRSIIF
ncbi:hypothetical protein PF003_g20407 [Phytophthora fragariae]|nr:hypothetical protein PF003_g20407 [Phytophthora fragariae]